MMDIPPEPPPAYEQVIEQKLIACGLNADGFTVKYEDYLQSVEIVIGASADASEDRFDCIREAVGREIVTFEDVDMQTAYLEASYELMRPRILAEAKAELEERGLLEGLPERADFESDELFAKALERHCGVEQGSFFVESQWGLIAQPKVTGKPLSSAEWDRMSCLMSVMRFVAAKGDTFKLGFVGNEMVHGSRHD